MSPESKGSTDDCMHIIISKTISFPWTQTIIYLYSGLPDDPIIVGRPNDYHPCFKFDEISIF